jgi:hypothetical protein
MLRSVASKAMWVGRTASAVFGLALVLALVLSVATMALAAVPGDPFKLGRLNTIDAISRLQGSVGGPMLFVDNNSSEPRATALRLQVEEGHVPMTLNSERRVKNLNADQLDGRDSSGFYAAGSKVEDSSHADQADNATNAANADKLGGENLEDVLPGGTLPSGATIRGTYNLYDEAHINEDATSDSISFGYTLASKPTVQVIEEGDSLTDQCPQRGDDFLDEVPEAASGFLCIYEWDEENERDGSGYPFITTTNRTGTGITLRSEGTGIFYSQGAWAVTAP